MAFWCKDKREFWADFSGNMAALNLPVPKNGFDSVQNAAISLAAVAAYVEKFGAATTVAEMVGAGLLSEISLGAGAALASGYVGAMIGSFIVAAQKDLMCGIDLFDAIQIAKAAGIASPWVYTHLARNPHLYDGTTTAGAVKTP